MCLGQQASSVASKIEEYAKKVQDDGFWLEMVDAEVFCREASKVLAVAVDQPDGRMVFKRSVEFWSVLQQEEGLQGPKKTVVGSSMVRFKCFIFEII